MNILNNVEKIFKEKGIRYFKSSDKKNKILNVPYRGIINESNHINIYITIDEQQKNLYFTFIEKANRNVDIETIRKKLLDLNSNLSYGTLSMKSDSCSIEYKLIYSLESQDFSFERYNAFIVRCVNVYEQLQKEDIIL